eukprot:gb/GECG01007491.1/.p1 GENE.gb/GECG01007491.1/~~gb/GECG01007491.1/.p1  ORF type:complete len:168 (+),score=26.52 gb/GECG01007491.1/:1-504(+)
MADADAVNFCSISQVDQDALQRVVTEKPDVIRLRQILKKYPNGACNSIRFGLDGKATLHSAAMFGYDKIADALLSEFGADVHQKTTMLKMTPLHLACQVGSLKCVRLFIEDYGALSDVEVKDDEGRTPRDVAMQGLEGGNEEVQRGKAEIINYFDRIRDGRLILCLK